jgi:hypothetical protein
MAREKKKQQEINREATKFEGFVARLLYDLHLKDVEWNVFYTRKNGSKRQVDIQYKRGLMKRVVLLECKYRTSPGAKIYLNEFGNGKYNGKRGNGNKKKAQEKEISHLVDEVDERRLYCNSRYGVIVTNAYFDHRLQEIAEQQDIELWDRDVLVDLVKKRSSILGISKLSWRRNVDLEAMINKTKKREYEFLKGGPYRS